MMRFFFLLAQIRLVQVAHTNVSLAEWGGKTNTCEIAVNLISIVRLTAVQTLVSHQKNTGPFLTQETGSHRHHIIDENMYFMAQPMKFYEEFIFVYVSPDQASLGCAH